MLRRENEETSAMMDGLLAEVRRGLPRPDALPFVPLALRGLVYGLARLYIDGHLPPWGVAKDEAENTLTATLELIISSLRRTTEQPRG